MNNFIINSNGQVLKDSVISEGAENFGVKTLFYKGVKNPDQVLKKLISSKNSYCVLKAKNVLFRYGILYFTNIIFLDSITLPIAISYLLYYFQFKK